MLRCNAAPETSPGGMTARAIAMSEPERKRYDALATAGPFATSILEDVRWLLCGRRRPVMAESSASPSSWIANAEVWLQAIEGPRVCGRGALR